MQSSWLCGAVAMFFPLNMPNSWYRPSERSTNAQCNNDTVIFDNNTICNANMEKEN